LGLGGGAVLANYDQEIWSVRGNCCYSLPTFSCANGATNL
jgi:hypothetical protein